MKKSEFYKIQDNCINFVKSGNRYPIQACGKTEVIIQPVRKDALKTIANATTNALTSSIANGNEEVSIILRISLGNDKEDIILNDEPIVRGNLDYHAMVKHARNLQDALKRDIGL